MPSISVFDSISLGVLKNMLDSPWAWGGPQLLSGLDRPLGSERRPNVGIHLPLLRSVEAATSLKTCWSSKVGYAQFFPWNLMLETWRLDIPSGGVHDWETSRFCLYPRS